MNYLKQYIKLVKKSLARDISELEGIYTEKHHIFPISIYGDNKLVVNLTYKEHLVAHHLLFKICLKRYGENHDRTIKMAYALYLLTNMASIRSLEATKIAVFIRKARKVRFQHTQKTREKLSKSLTGRTRSEESRKKQSQTNKGRTYSEESIKRMSEAQRGKKRKPRSEKTRKKISETLKGRTYSKESIKRMSEAQKKRTNRKSKPLSEKTRKKTSKDNTSLKEVSKTNKSKKGRSPSPETRAKLSKAKKGKPRSEESRKKQSIAQIGMHAGSKHPNFDHTLRDWINIETGETELKITTFDLIRYYDLAQPLVSRVVNGISLHHRGWMLLT